MIPVKVGQRARNGCGTGTGGPGTKQRVGMANAREVGAGRCIGWKCSGAEHADIWRVWAMRMAVGANGECVWLGFRVKGEKGRETNQQVNKLRAQWGLGWVWFDVQRRYAEHAMGSPALGLWGGAERLPGPPAKPVHLHADRVGRCA